MLTSKKTLVTHYPHVYEGDPAVTCGEDGIRKYIETGDESHLELQGDPARFKLQHLKGLARMHIESALGASDGEIPLGIIIEACRLALLDVENISDEDDKKFQVRRKYDKDLRCKVVSEDTMDALYELDRGIIPSIGYRVVTELFLDRSK